MIRKIILTMVGIILVVLLVLLIIIAYFLIVDIQSKSPKTISQECEITSYKFIGRNVFVLTPKIKNENEKVILYFHGGSYVAETSQEHWKFLEKLAKDTGYTIILPYMQSYVKSKNAFAVFRAGRSAKSHAFIYSKKTSTMTRIVLKI